MVISYVSWISRGIVEIKFQGWLLRNYFCGKFKLIARQHMALLIMNHIAQYDRLNEWPVMKWHMAHSRPYNKSQTIVKI
jgi:hypothetical protein